MSGLDSFSKQAVGILTSSALADALDITKESKEIQEKYGTGDKKFRDDGAPKMTENFLIARAARSETPFHIRQGLPKS